MSIGRQYINITLVLLLCLNVFTKLIQRSDGPTISITKTTTTLSTRDGSTTTSPNNGTSSWMGDAWIPTTPQRLYSAPEMRQLLANESILFVGDSTARRAYATLYSILNSTTQLEKDYMDNPYYIDVNKAGRLQEHCWSNSKLFLCRQLMSLHTRMDMASASCNSGVQAVFHNLDTSMYTLIVVAYGGWHQSYKCKATVEDQWFLLNTTSVHKTLQAIVRHHHQHNLAVVWRTMGMPARPTDNIIDRTRRINQFVVDQVHHYQQPWLTALDWGSVLEARTIPWEDRIRGDIRYHFGLEARLVFLQLLMHRLVAMRQYQEGVHVVQ